MTFLAWLIFAIILVFLALAVGAVVGGGLAFMAGLLGWAPPGGYKVPRRGRERPVIPAALRRAVLERDHYQCVECGSTEDLELDHEIAFSKGGATTFENLRVLCSRCNEMKGAN